MDTISKCVLIKVKLYELGFTQRDIAKALNVTEPYVSMLIKGTRKSQAFESWVFANLGI